MTEIYDYLRLRYARVGIPHCPTCGRQVVKQSAQEIVDAIRGLPEGSKLLVLGPLVRGRKGTYQAVFEEIRKAGFLRMRVDGEVRGLEDEIELDRYKMHNIEAVVDRLVIQPGESEEDKKAFISRLTDSVETALFILWRQEGDQALPLDVTASYNEGGRWLDGGHSVDSVPMPPEIFAWVGEFVEQNYRPEPKKRIKPRSFVHPKDRVG